MQEERNKQSGVDTESNVPEELENQNVNENAEVSKGQNQSLSNDVTSLLMGDSIIKNINPRKISKKKTVKVCLPGKRAEQIATEVKSIPLTNPSHVIIHA